MSELSTVISVGGIAALVTLFFNSFKGGYEIRRNMFRVSAMADKNIGKWHRKVLLSMSAKDEQVIVLSITSISGRFLSNTGEIVKRIELNKTLMRVRAITREGQCKKQAHAFGTKTEEQRLYRLSRVSLNRMRW